MKPLEGGPGIREHFLSHSHQSVDLVVCPGRIVAHEDEFLYARFLRSLRGLGPGAVAPADVVVLVLLWALWGVVDEHVRSRREFP